MEDKEQKNLLNFRDFSAEELEIIQQLGFHRVFEPFEVNLAIRLVRTTRVKMEKKISPILDKISNYKQKITTKIPVWNNKIKNHLPKYNKDNENYTLQELKKNYSVWEEKIKHFFFQQLDKALSIIFERELEYLIINKAKKLFKIEIKNITDIQKLTRKNRILLLENMYPFELTFTGKVKKNINRTSNVLLGLVVASNIPFTGATVNLVTTFKTIIYLSNRLHLLSSIYGYPVISKQAIFFVSTQIVQSIIDYENNKNHQPLDPNTIKDLYRYTNKSKLFELIKHSTIKDFYISIPLVGSLSLVKISLDEDNVTKLTLQLVRDYFDIQELKKKYGEEKLEKEIECWQNIYAMQKKIGWIEKLIYNATEKKEEKKKLQKILQKVKDIESGSDKILQIIHKKAKEIYFYRKKNLKINLEEIVRKFCQ